MIKQRLLKLLALALLGLLIVVAFWYRNSSLSPSQPSSIVIEQPNQTPIAFAFQSKINSLSIETKNVNQSVLDYLLAKLDYPQQFSVFGTKLNAEVGQINICKALFLKIAMTMLLVTLAY